MTHTAIMLVIAAVLLGFLSCAVLALERMVMALREEIRKNKATIREMQDLLRTHHEILDPDDRQLPPIIGRHWGDD